MLAPLAALFAAPLITAEEEIAILSALEELAEAEPDPLEVPLPASVVIDGVVDRKSLSVLRDFLQRDANDNHLPIRFYIREASTRTEMEPDPDPKRRAKGKLVEKIVPVPAALIAGRQVPSAQRP
jgi:hypothetical protein